MKTNFFSEKISFCLHFVGVLLLGKLTLITTASGHYLRSPISPPLLFREGLLLHHMKDETPMIMHTEKDFPSRVKVTVN
jgi:hypothetical protein